MSKGFENMSHNMRQLIKIYEVNQYTDGKVFFLIKSQSNMRPLIRFQNEWPYCKFQTFQTFQGAREPWS